VAARRFLLALQAERPGPLWTRPPTTRADRVATRPARVLNPLAQLSLHGWLWKGPRPMSASYPRQPDHHNAQDDRSPARHRPLGVTDGTTPGRISPDPDPLRNWKKRAKLHEAKLQAQRRDSEQFEKEHDLAFPSHGIIDHVRLSLLEPLAKRDRRSLSDLGFEPERHWMRAKRGPGNLPYDAEPGAEVLVRASDGCRVQIWPDRVAVVGSLSRILGLTNDRLAELSPFDAAEACGRMSGLFPLTTCRASIEDGHWAVLEAALTIDVPAEAKRFASAYEKSKWTRVRSMPKRHPRGLEWGGADNRLTLYDKGAEMREHGLAGPPPGSVMRVEREWRGARAITALAGAIEQGTTGPPLLFVKRREKVGTFTMPLWLDHRVLHGVLAQELNRLDAPLPLGASAADVLAAFMNENERLHEALRQVWDPKTYRKHRRKMLALKAEGLPTLLQACYGRASVRGVAFETSNPVVTFRTKTARLQQSAPSIVGVGEAVPTARASDLYLHHDLSS